MCFKPFIAKKATIIFMDVFVSQESLGSPEDVGSAAAHRLLSEAALFMGL